jgi:uracil-DNA glycosylase family 4
MEKEKKGKLLEDLKQKMEKDDSLPLKKGATRLVFGVGNPEAQILFIGEGPGYWEDQKGEPFVGNAGKLLDTLLQSIELERSDVYITNVVHHRAPENRDPLPGEIKAYENYLNEIIRIIDPKVIVTLGRFSMAKFLPFVKISSVHGKVRKVKWDDKEFVVIPMYHPAAALRNPEVMRQEKADFLKMPEILTHMEKEEKQSKLEGEQMNLI